MAILTNGNYYSSFYIGNLTSAASVGNSVNSFNFPLGRREQNLAIYSTSTTSNASKSGSYMFKQTTADTATAFNLKIQTYLDNTYKEQILKNGAGVGVHKFTYTLTNNCNKIRIGANGSARDTLAIFVLPKELYEGAVISVTVKISNATQGSFQFGEIMIVELNKAVGFLPSPQDGGSENYLETEPFKIQGKYGPRVGFSSTEPLKECLVDVDVKPSTFSGKMRAVAEDGSFTVDVNFTNANQLTCASINQMVLKACITNYGETNAGSYFSKLNKIYWVSYSLTGDITCYYHNTLDVIKTYASSAATTTTDWKLTNQTITMSNGSNGATLINKSILLVSYITNSLYLTAKTINIQFGSNYSKVGSYQFIPNFKKAKIYYKNACERYQSLLGENSIDGILNYHTEQKVVVLKASNVTASTISLSGFYYINSGNIGVDYKVIPCGSDVSNRVNYQPVKLLSSAYGNSYSNDYLTIKSSSSTGSLSTNYSAHSGTTSGQTVYVYLFDEDEFDRNYTDVSLYNTYGNAYVYAYTKCAFIPVQPETLLDGYGNVLSGRTNGLIKSIKFGTRTQLDSGNAYGCYTGFPETSSKNTAQWGDNYCIARLEFNASNIGSKKISSDCIQKENFSFVSCDSIFFDGVPHPCNKDYYLTGKMVMVPAYNRSYFSNTFFLYIGARRINQTILNKTVGYFGPIEFTSDYFSYIEGFTYWNSYTPQFSFRDINETDFRLSNKLVSLTDLNRKYYTYFAPSFIYMGIGFENADWDGCFNKFEQHMNSHSSAIGATLSSGIGIEDNLQIRKLVIHKSSGVGIEFGPYVDNEHNIRVMIYPTYSNDTTTTVTNVSGVCINDNYDSNITHIIGSTNSSQYNSIKSAWETYEGLTINNLSGHIGLYYNDGRYISSYGAFLGTFGISANVGIFDPGLSASVGYNIPQIYGSFNGDTEIWDDKYSESVYAYLGNKYPTLGGDYLPVETHKYENPTIETAFHGEEVRCACTAIIKFDFTERLYFIDISVSLMIPDSYYSSSFNFGRFSDLQDDFSCTIKFYDSSVTVYPLSNTTNLNTFEMNDNVITMSFRVYETNKVPFNPLGKNMKMYFSYAIYATSSTSYYNHDIDLSRCLLNCDTSYQNSLFHYVPCVSNVEQMKGVTGSGGTASHYTLSANTTTGFSNATCGLTLKTTSISTSTQYFGMRWTGANTNIKAMTGQTMIDTGTCIVSSVVLVKTANISQGKYAIPFNYNTATFPLCGRFPLSASTVVGEWYLMHYSYPNVVSGVPYESIFNGTSNIINSTSNYNIRTPLYGSNGNPSYVYVGYRNSGTTTSTDLLYGINIKYVDLSYFNDITHSNLYF